MRTFPVTATPAGYFFKIETEREVEIERRGLGSLAQDLTIY